MGQHDLIFDPFEKVTGIPEELDPRHWKRLIRLLDHYVDAELERREVIPDETPIPIAKNVALF